MHHKITPIILALILISSCARILQKGPEYQLKKEQKLIEKARKKVEKCIAENMSGDVRGPIPVNSKIDSITIDSDLLKLNIYLSKHFSYQPFRPESIEPIYKLFKKYLGRKFRKFDVTILTLNEPIERLIPNFFREDTSEFDRARLPEQKFRLLPPLVQNKSKKGFLPKNGLYNRNVALWHSHGFYYNEKKDRWEWQRPRLFCTVEDLLPMSFTIPYLIPMLENAGANVFIPRERSLQTHEVIIDNDSSGTFIGTGQYRKYPADSWRKGGTGFAIGNPPYPANLNPFLQGTYCSCQSDTAATAYLEWIPDIPETGFYSVYISYHHAPENVPDAQYFVYHTGGVTEFSINQQIGGETWIHLGEFKFDKGFHPETGKVVLMNKSKYPGKQLTADAVRFGGGMGNILRGGRVSGYPRFAEGARYYLQYAGMPDTLVYSLNQDTSDYKDDYQSRGEFVNFLKGKPFGPNKNRDVDGLGIPIDLSMSFHTDAGIDTADSTIGTLMIYSIEDAETLRVFPDGMSRLANRDLADIVQTQIVQDIRMKYRPDWKRRALMNADYSEAFRPNVPAFLLELLSHQNFKDMQFALSPQFRFDVARSIYKGMLKFIATQNNYTYTIQPLPVSHFQALFTNQAEVVLKWKPVPDPLEPSALPEKYLVYTRQDDRDFDNGVLVETTQYIVKNLEPGVIYRFKVTALNQGGESFPSEELSVCWQPHSPATVLVINGFDRVSPPEMITQPQFKGFAPFLDPGVADKYDFNYTGIQFDFDPHSQFRTNDAPGHGASLGNHETQIRIGNTFDYPYTHGKAIKSSGYSFVSCSDEAVFDGDIDLTNFRIIDLILGEEKTFHFKEINEKYHPYLQINRNYQAFPPELQEKLKNYLLQGGNLFVSGAYVGTDLVGKQTTTEDDIVFARDILKIEWQTDHAVATGKFYSVDSPFLKPYAVFRFNTNSRHDIYTVVSPDAIDPAKEAITLLRYGENRFGAATGYFGDYSVIVFGFPFESIIDDTSRAQVMKAVLDSFENKKSK